MALMYNKWKLVSCIQTTAWVNICIYIYILIQESGSDVDIQFLRNDINITITYRSLGSCARYELATAARRMRS